VNNEIDHSTGIQNQDKHTLCIYCILYIPTPNPIYSCIYSNIIITYPQHITDNYSIILQEEQQLHSTSGLSGGLQSATKVPRNPGGLVLLRLAQTSAGITPVRSLSLKKAIPE
jgi:hypothetical protein